MRDVKLLHGKISDTDLIDTLFDNNSGMVIISVFPDDKVKVVAFDMTQEQASEVCAEASHGFRVTRAQ